MSTEHVAFNPSTHQTGKQISEYKVSLVYTVSEQPELHRDNLPRDKCGKKIIGKISAQLSADKIGRQCVPVGQIREWIV